jgi:hypothetical protein
MNEKRREKRFTTKQKVWCEGQQSGESAESRDISRSGMAVVTGKAAEVGSHMKVTFAVPGGENVAVNMEVVWRQKPTEGKRIAMGLRVIDFDKGKEAFDRFVSSHLGESESEPGSDKDKE